MKVYYELEPYHYKEIKRKGFTKGKEVWFADIDSLDEMIGSGIVVGYDIYDDGYIMLELKITEKYTKIIPKHIFVSDENNREEKHEYTFTKNIFMDFCFFTKEEAIKCAKKLIKRKIKTKQHEIKYYEEKLKNIEGIQNNA